MSGYFQIIPKVFVETINMPMEVTNQTWCRN